MRVLVVDDQTVVREGLAVMLGTLDGIDVVGQAANGQEAIGALEHDPADVVLMDLNMPVLDGIAATAAIRARHPDTQVVVLTTYGDDHSIVAALQAGAIGYLTKESGREGIRRALEAAAAGQSVLDPAVQARLVAAASVPRDPNGPAPDGLTEREVDVLRLVAEGLSNTDIAARLFIGEATVKTHINHIFAKTHSRDRAQAVAYAHRLGLV
ncbi:MAG TPA: response regulator transcription factor [Acidimicrobiales bacterium]|nr:response regulator transcription factor [Acidimicrobiales bacterium]